jgi:tetratricopeptide (TPR) repeat protein
VAADSPAVSRGFGSDGRACVDRESIKKSVHVMLSVGAPPMSSESESPDQQKAKTFFQYGNEALTKSNLDYAIAMYRQASKLVPDNMMYRQSLRGVERKKFNNDPKKVGMLVGVKNQPILMQAKSARGKGKHHEALEHCEDAFANNPWDVAAARVAAEAAEGLELGALAIWLLDSVQEVAAKGKDYDFFKFAAGIYEANESWHKAIACWENVKKFSPNDPDANRKINALSAASTIKRAKLDDALDVRAQAKPVEETESMQAKLDKLKLEQLSPEQRLVKEIVSDPKATHAYVQLADLYRQRSELDKAEKVLAKGLKANPDDQGLLQIYEDTQIGRLRRAIEVQKHRVQERPEETAAQVKLDELTQMLDKYEIQAFRRRIKLHPEDAKLHYELGSIFARTAAYDEAIGEFQQAARTSTVPAVKIQALLQMGLSFEANSAPKLAERNYKEALKLVEPEDKENFNALHYRLGRVAEALGNNESAEEHYNEVAANDYTYLDVAERLRRLI